MPEIAEVRLVTDNVRSFLKGNILQEIEVVTDNYKQARKLSGLELVLPQLVTDVKTKGKFSYIVLANGDAIGYGLGMSGNIRVEPTPEYMEIYNRNMGKKVTAEQYLKHAHLKLKYLDDNTEKHFYYHDQRRFGTWSYLKPEQLKSKLSTIGPDLIDENLDFEQVVKLFRKYNNQNICTALMSQKVVGGVGNYMKAEILYNCKIWPMAKIRQLTDTQINNIYLAAREIAYRAYTYGGTTLYTYTGMKGDQGDFKTQLLIYSRSFDPYGNQVITTNKTPDKRTTHWVPAVQSGGRPLIKVTSPKKTSQPQVPSSRPKLKLNLKLKKVAT